MLTPQLIAKALLQCKTRKDIVECQQTVTDQYRKNQITEVDFATYYQFLSLAIEYHSNRKEN